MKNKIFCIVGPSGAGKDRLKERFPLPQVVSYRTRDPRPFEKEGIDGHFITTEEFLMMKDAKLWIAETYYAGAYYGITQGEIIPLEDSPMLYVIDWPGVETLRKAFDELEGYSAEQIVSIFIYVPKEQLVERMGLQGRNPKEIETRLARLEQDYKAMDKCDYIVSNYDGEFTQAIIDIHNIILKESFNLEERR